MVLYSILNYSDLPKKQICCIIQIYLTSFDMTLVGTVYIAAYIFPRRKPYEIFFKDLGSQLREIIIDFTRPKLDFP